MSELARAVLPDLSHLSAGDYEEVYEPSDDTFLLVDVLAAEAGALRARRPLLCMEIGCGSGCVITHLGTVLHSCQGSDTPAALVASDINMAAVRAASASAHANGISMQVLQMDLLTAMRPGCLDVLIFNPPYVPTSEAELQEAAAQAQISASWAGGPRGRLVLDRLLPHVAALLSASGVFYLLGVRENDPSELASILRAQGLEVSIVAERRAQNERLFVLRASSVTFPG